jgi:hypothetical protein
MSLHEGSLGPREGRYIVYGACNMLGVSVFMSFEAARTRQSCIKRAAGRKNRVRDCILYHTKVASHVRGLSEIRSTI